MRFGSPDQGDASLARRHQRGSCRPGAPAPPAPPAARRSSSVHHASQGGDGDRDPRGPRDARAGRDARRHADVHRRLPGRRHGRAAPRQPRLPARRAGVPGDAAGRVARGPAPRVPGVRRRQRHGAAVRVAARRPVAVPDAEHRDRVRVRLARPARRAGRARLPAGDARHGQRRLGPVRRGHRPERARPRPGRRVPAPAAGLRRSCPGRLPRRSLDDVQQPLLPPRVPGRRRSGAGCGGDPGRPAHLPAGRGRAAAADAHRRRQRRAVLDHRAAGRLVLRARARAGRGGARRRARRGDARSAGLDRDRQGPPLRA